MRLGLTQVPGLHLLAAKHRKGLGVSSLSIEGLHYNLAVPLLTIAACHLTWRECSWVANDEVYQCYLADGPGHLQVD